MSELQVPIKQPPPPPPPSLACAGVEDAVEIKEESCRSFELLSDKLLLTGSLISWESALCAFTLPDVELYPDSDKSTSTELMIILLISMGDKSGFLDITSAAVPDTKDVAIEDPLM